MRVTAARIVQTILHAAFLDGNLVCWGESGPADEREGQVGKAYGLDAPTLRALLREALAGLEVAGWPSVDVVAWLPTRRKAPIPSEQFMAPTPASRARTSVEPWRIQALGLDAQAALELLSHCAGREQLAPDLLVGDDLAFWCRALRLTAESVAAQRFLPGIAYDERQRKYRALWEPVLGDRERKLAADLAPRMPGACRALTAAKKLPPALGAVAVLDAFIAQMLDRLVRTAAATPTPGNDRMPVQERWLFALRAADSELRGTQSELQGLAAQIESWRRAVLEQHASTHRLCLRVEEPEHDGELWRVAYLLQSRTDPSLLIEVKQAWKEPKLRRALLASIGHAVGISSHIEKSLHEGESMPLGFTLDADAIYEFLSSSAWQLEHSGIGVILPAWWLGKNTKTRLSVRARIKPSAMQGGGGLRADSLLDVDWSVAVGDESLTQRELQALAKLKIPLVRIRGQWVHVDGDEIRAALDRMKKGARQLSMREIVRMQLDPLASIETSGAVSEFLTRLQGERAFAEVPLPKGLKAVLRPYQMRGYSWLRFLSRAGLGACLADDMGLGKTIQTLTLILRDWREDGKAPVLLVCPTSVIGNWLREAQRFTPQLPVNIHHGSDRVRTEKFARDAKQHALVVTSYALLHRDIELFKSVPWRGVVLDEAQNIKNAESKQARAARELSAGYRVALTGTPVENHVGDLWAIMEFLNPGMLGSHAAFKREFFVPIQALRDRDASERLKRVSGPFVLRRLKSDRSIIADLPSKHEMKVFCTLTREQASLYAAVLREFNETLDETKGMQRRGMILATLSKLKQVCNHPAHFAKDNSPVQGRSGKLARLEEMLEEVLDVKERALIFTQFAEMGTLLQGRLCERFAREVVFLHGGVPKKKRDEMVERFQSEHGPAIFVLSLKAGGSGLNLTRANHVFHFDRWWNPAVENQATDRAFRIGQSKSVQVHKFVCAGTLEEKIDAMIENKRAVAEQVVGSGEHWLTELSSAQLRDLMALAPEAVEE